MDLSIFSDDSHFFLVQAGSIVPRANAASSVMTTSNTPSVVSSSPSSEQIEFKPHTSDLDDDEGDRNVAYRSNKVDIIILLNLLFVWVNQCKIPAINVTCDLLISHINVCRSIVLSVFRTQYI